MQTIILLFCIVLHISSSLCPTGFVQISLVACSNAFGPCLTTNLDIGTSTFGSCCLTCYDDAFLWPQASIAACIPYLCNSIGSLGAGSGCTGCQTGYSLSANRSCVLNQVSTQTSASQTNQSVSNSPDHVSQSLILSATAIICLILWMIFKCTEGRCQWKKDEAIIHVQTASTQNRDSQNNRNSKRSLSELVLVESMHPTELNRFIYCL